MYRCVLNHKNTVINMLNNLHYCLSVCARIYLKVSMCSDNSLLYKTATILTAVFHVSLNKQIVPKRCATDFFTRQMS